MIRIISILSKRMHEWYRKGFLMKIKGKKKKRHNLISLDGEKAEQYGSWVWLKHGVTWAGSEWMVWGNPWERTPPLPLTIIWFLYMLLLTFGVNCKPAQSWINKVLPAHVCSLGKKKKKSQHADYLAAWHFIISQRVLRDEQLLQACRGNQYLHLWEMQR